MADDPLRLIETAEDIGHYLGMSNATGALKIYHLIEPVLKQLYRDLNNNLFYHEFLMLKPKIAFIIANSGYRERSPLELFHNVILEGMDLIANKEGNINSDHLQRFIDFIDAIISYQGYAQAGGARKTQIEEIKYFQDRILQLQTELEKLSQFVTASTKKMKVFLSHAHEDKPFVERLRKDLENKGITTWYDDKDLDIGDILTQVISEGIKQSWCFLIVVSPAAIKSGWVEYELNEAYHDHVTQKKRILPVLIGNIKEDQIPSRLQKHLWADFRNESEYDKTFEKLYKAIVKEGSKEVK